MSDPSCCSSRLEQENRQLASDLAHARSAGATYKRLRDEALVAKEAAEAERDKLRHDYGVLKAINLTLEALSGRTQLERARHLFADNEPLVTLSPEDLEELRNELEELRRDAQECGDWPAPCNCDDPTTHNGH